MKQIEHMTIEDKMKAIQVLVDKLPESQLGEVLIWLQGLSQRDETRKEILSHLLQTEKALFEKLAQ